MPKPVIKVCGITNLDEAKQLDELGINFLGFNFYPKSKRYIEPEKALEIIEAHYLFGVAPENIEVVIHPQSIVHSMVELIDGSIKAQMGLPDMKLPIQYALGYPERLPVVWENTDFMKIRERTFEAPDFAKFPSLKLAHDALQRGGTAPAILNVVNEYAVYAFLENKIRFIDIPRFVEDALSDLPIEDNPELGDILEVEQSGREFVERKILERN